VGFITEKSFLKFRKILYNYSGKQTIKETMMREKLSIPPRVKVGFQKRGDTYTGKLAYVISMGQKRKEDPRSWTGWIDKKIPVEEFDNTPMQGFVLNRDVGGTQRSWSWNARREKVRVYDPRDFEFEITVENVLLILQECSSIKGKGLEGEFVLAWSGHQIVLLPTCSQEYKYSVEMADLASKKLSRKEIVEGCTYTTKDKQEVMYLGKHTWFDYHGKYYSYYSGSSITCENKHVFLILNENRKGRDRYLLQDGFNRLAIRTSDKPVASYAEEYEKLMKSQYVSKPVEITVEDGAKVSFPQYYNYTNICVADNGKYYIGRVQKTDWTYPSQGTKPTTYAIECTREASLKDGEYSEIDCKRYEKKNLTLEEVEMLSKKLYLKCENGSKYRIGKDE
jgi:hypothetical protein